jgi:hypothetical protein
MAVRMLNLGYEDEKWMKQAQIRAQWQVWAVVSLPEF